ncbi:hypothetical protein [Geomonas ferrireducens]|uniref:hypothetical protein n=1 Tax=Geomonas ferrireducens TaxID=2570227 RepID=UPI0010A7BA60|nr:hypothetical protein [Geomonas ferrireducens]
MRFLVFAAVLLLPVVSNADRISVAMYETVPQSEDLVTAYVQGVGVGLEDANYYLEVSHQKKLFCVPEGKDLKYRKILDAYLALHEMKEDAKPLFTIDSVLFLALKSMYPCTTAKKDNKRK